jgi:hypothetical protein
MPRKSAEQLKQKTQTLKKKLADKGASLDATKVRAMKKKIRRVQRRRRSMDARAKRLAPKPAASE